MRYPCWLLGCDNHTTATDKVNNRTFCTILTAFLEISTYSETQCRKHPLNGSTTVWGPAGRRPSYRSLAAGPGIPAGWGTAAGTLPAEGPCPAGTPLAAGCTGSFLQSEGDTVPFMCCQYSQLPTGHRSIRAIDSLMLPIKTPAVRARVCLGHHVGCPCCSECPPTGGRAGHQGRNPEKQPGQLPYGHGTWLCVGLGGHQLQDFHFRDSQYFQTQLLNKQV